MEKKQNEFEETMVAHHDALHFALPVTAVRAGDRFDANTGEFIKGTGPIVAFKDTAPISTNLFHGDSHSDRLLDHFLGHKAYLSGKCNCPEYMKVLHAARVNGDKGEFMSMRRRLLARC